MPQAKRKFDLRLAPLESSRLRGEVLGHNEHHHVQRIEVLEGDAIVAIAQIDGASRSVTGARNRGFSIDLPDHLFDGELHRLQVRVADSTTLLSSSSIELRSSARSVSGELSGFHGASLAGWITAAEGQVLDIVLLDGAEQVARFRVAMPGDTERIEFEISLPAPSYDGNHHRFRLCIYHPYQVLHQAAFIAPLVTTPPAVLQAVARHFPAHLSPVAALRYESLSAQLSLFGSRGKKIREAAANELQNIGAAHDLLQGTRGVSDVELSVPCGPSPQASIIIPAHNQLAYTMRCLASLVVAPVRAAFEVIVVDDASDDETRDIENRVHGIRVVRNRENLGYLRSCNVGAKKARGEFLVILNNDTEVSAYWLDELLATFAHDEQAGIVGPKLIYPDGRLQEAGGIVYSNAEPANYGRNQNPADPRYNYVREADYISGACLAVRRTLWDKLGGYDETFAPAYYEDTDFALRVRAAGARVVYTPFAQIVHAEGASNGTDVKAGIKRFQAVNAEKFQARWRGKFKAEPPLGDPDAHGPAMLRALVIDAQAPQADRDAGGYAAIKEMQLLQALGYRLTFAPANVAYLGNYSEALGRLGVRCVYAPFVTSVEELIQTEGPRYQLIYITRYAVAQRYIALIRKRAPHAKIVFNNADLHFLREIRAAIAARDRQGMARALKTRDEELAVMKDVDLVLSYSKVEHAVITSHNLDLSKLAVCPWVADFPSAISPFERRADVAFLGGFKHAPNVEAVEYFIREVMPPLRKALPRVKLRVYGSYIPDYLRALACDDIVFVGEVAEVSEVYDNCRVFVAPLLTGAGMKGKVVGALAHGTPCVLSEIAAEGIPVRSGVEAWIAETPASWVSAVASLYKDKAAWKKMSEACRRLAEDQFSLERGVELMRKALNSVGLHET